MCAAILHVNVAQKKGTKNGQRKQQQQQEEEVECFRNESRVHEFLSAF